MKPELQNKIIFSGYKVERLEFDLSHFEAGNINIDLGVKSSFSDENSKLYLIKMSLTITSPNTNFSLECDIVGKFETENDIDDNFKQSHFVKVNSPAILFPYLRSYITTVTSNSGINPIIIPTINFTYLDRD